MKKHRHSILICCTLCLWPFTASQATEFYRYLDDYGTTVIQGKKPAHNFKKEYAVVDDKGRVIKVVKPVTSKKEKAEQKKQRERDSFLLNTYTNVNDLKNAFEAEINSIDTKIKMAQEINKDLQSQLEKLISEAAHLERNGKKVSNFYHQAVSDTRRQIHKNNDYIEQKELEKKSVSDTFAGDIKRFEALKEEEDTFVSVK